MLMIRKAVNQSINQSIQPVTRNSTRASDSPTALTIVIIHNTLRHTSDLIRHKTKNDKHYLHRYQTTRLPSYNHHAAIVIVSQIYIKANFHNTFHFATVTRRPIYNISYQA